LGILIALVAFLLIFDPSSGWVVRNFIYQPGTGRTDASRMENDSLRAELARLKDVTVTSSGDLIAAYVYSRYPFNFKNEIILDAGKNEGVEMGRAILIPVPGASSTAAQSVLLGKITQVADLYSSGQTVFDTRFQLAVLVGEKGVESLLAGGTEPKLTLLPKIADVKEGDIVYSASPGYPYGTALGRIKNITLSSDQLFKEGVLDVPYDLNDIRDVLISKN